MPKKLTFPKKSGRFDASIPGLAQPATSHIPSTFTDGLPLPKVFVFDIDYTLWPFWVDTHPSTPVKPAHKDPSQNTAMLDRYGETYTFYREVPGILHAARQNGITMGLASRTHAPALAEKMMRNIMIPVPPPLAEEPQHEDTAAAAAAAPIETSTPSLLLQTTDENADKPSTAWSFFTYREIYPGSKIKHFNRIQTSTRKTGHEIPFADMIFFDDEGRNREVETQLGVTFVLVRDGVTIAEIDRGVREWRRRRGVDGAHPDGAEEGEDDVAELDR